MSEVDVNQVLAQMRVLAAQAQGLETARPAQGPGQDFADLLKQSVDKVNATQGEAKRLSEAFETGAKDADLGQVMVAVQKASVSFQAMTQVRNKLVEAYRDVMNMPL
ncbi:MAG: flagellar hook-basal body complex protein FliE [Chromatiales bacterium]|nr:flagellar hook-basal body complex protein FliE [Chromatiales bacterium]